MLRDFNALLLKNFIFKLKKLFLGQGVLPSPWLALNSDLLASAPRALELKMYPPTPGLIFSFYLFSLKEGSCYITE